MDILRGALQSDAKDEHYKRIHELGQDDRKSSTLSKKSIQYMRARKNPICKTHWRNKRV